VAQPAFFTERNVSPLPGWHPLVVHFPLALVLVATPLLLAARLLRSEAIASTAAMVGTWNLCIGAVAALFALATGLGAVLDLDVDAATHQAISLHMKWAMFSTLVLVLLAVWRGAGTAQGSRPSWVFIIVLLAAAAALVVTGYRGGENVYEFGVGVKRIAVRSEAPHRDSSLSMPLLSRRVVAAPGGNRHRLNRCDGPEYDKTPSGQNTRNADGIECCVRKQCGGLHAKLAASITA
jgi:uncharacterized membrane protein